MGTWVSLDCSLNDDMLYKSVKKSIITVFIPGGGWGFQVLLWFFCIFFLLMEPSCFNLLVNS